MRSAAAGSRTSSWAASSKRTCTEPRRWAVRCGSGAVGGAAGRLRDVGVGDLAQAVLDGDGRVLAVARHGELRADDGDTRRARLDDERRTLAARRDLAGHGAAIQHDDGRAVAVAEADGRV